MIARWTITCAAALALTACGARQAYPPSLAGLPSEPSIRSVAAAPRLIFHDEFDGTSLNTNVWYRCYNWADENVGCKTNPGELEWYQTANVTVSGGSLHLTAQHRTVHSKGKTYRYTSGMIQSGGWPANGSTSTFSYLYGYAEVRAQLPAGRIGMWPAFWLLPADNTWPPEVDIMEWQGVSPTQDNTTLWWSLPNGDKSVLYNAGVNLSRGYHTYGLDWQSSYTDFYFDRKRVMHYAGVHVPQKAMFVLINLAIGGWEPGQLNPPANEFPTAYSVDYVRVWDKRPF